MNSLSRGIRSIRRRGVVGTLTTGLAVLGDLYFDWRYHTNTAGRYDLKGDEGRPENREYVRSYTPTRVQGIRKCLKSLNLPRNGCFVDLGCGKGRTLLLAAEYGFSRIVGVEFSEPLCRIAQENVEHYSRKTGVQAQFQVVYADVAEYEIEDDQTVFFIFNSFGVPILTEVVKSIEVSWRRRPRPLWLIYHNPVHREDVLCTGFLNITGEYQFCASEYVIYEPGLRVENEQPLHEGKL